MSSSPVRKRLRFDDCSEDAHMICSCCHMRCSDVSSVEFNASYYDFGNSDILTAFSCPVSCPPFPQVVCDSCHMSLTKDVPEIPYDAAVLSMRRKHRPASNLPHVNEDTETQSVVAGCSYLPQSSPGNVVFNTPDIDAVVTDLNQGTETPNVVAGCSYLPQPYSQNVGLDKPYMDYVQSDVHLAASKKRVSEVNCHRCSSAVKRSTLKKFDIGRYNTGSQLVKRLSALEIFASGKAYICSKCDSALLRENTIVCLKCNNHVKKKDAVLSRSNVDSFDLSLNTDGKPWLCKKCKALIRYPTSGLPQSSTGNVASNTCRVNQLDSDVCLPGSVPFTVELNCDRCSAIVNRTRLKKFDIARYNIDSRSVKRLCTLDMFASGNAYICSKCDGALLRENTIVCLMCNNNVKKRDALLSRSNVDSFDLSLNVDGKAWVCKECNALTGPKFKCLSCDMCFRRDRVIRFNKDKYDFEDDMVATTLVGGSDDDYICQGCDRKMMATLTCTCCHGKFHQYRMKIFTADHYDFEDYIVSRALSDKCRVCIGDTEYICLTCSSRLLPAPGDFPMMPRNAHARCVRDPGSKFLRAIREKPEFVCTCCHRKLFRRAVMPFLLGKYDFSADIVRETLSDRYRYPMKVHIYKGVRNAHIHPTDFVGVDGEYDEIDDEGIDADEPTYDNNANDRINPDVHVETFEYICKNCHLYLSRRTPKMPPQACANGLLLPAIPPELQGLTDIERRLISLRIPFMSIFCAVRYGSSYKVKGGCTNVPASLDQVVDMLPRMSSDVQYHKMQLKKKMVYKSCYMENYIRKDKVMAAIMWLKCNNPLYRDIELNNGWVDDWESGDLSMFMVDGNPISAAASCDNDRDADPDDDDAHVMDGNLNPTIHENSEFTTDGEVPAAVAQNKALERREHLEDRAAMEKSLDTVGYPLPNCLQEESLENEIYTCAPGENQTPQYMLMDDHFETLAFPDLFPYGTGCYAGYGHKTKLTLRKYFQQRLLNVDGRFAHNIEYLFCAQYVTDIKHIQGEAGIALRQKRGRMLNGQAVTAGMLRNPAVLNRLVRDEHAYKFLRHIRGSPAYWQHELYELLAMLRTFGIPTWFMTLSAADLHWVEMIEAVTACSDKPLSLKQIRNMPIRARAEKLKKNPVSAVTMFQYRVESFFSEYLYDATEPVGAVKEHAIKMEFQERGSPHAHCLLWVDGAPRVDVDSDADVCAFVDKYVSGCIPDDNVFGNRRMAKLVREFETHSHSQYCRRKHTCRFAFPKAPSPRTIICREPDDDENRDEILRRSTEILKKVHELIEEMSDDPQPLAAILDKAGVTEAEYVRALTVTRKGRNIILKRDPADCYTNGCSHSILGLWRANIDFQFVFDEITCIIYISSYMMKGEKAMGEVLKSIAKECMEDPIAEKLKKIGKAFVGKRVVGAPEAAMRELSMWVMRKSRKVTFVNSNMRDERSSIPKSAEALKNMEEDDENIYMTSIHDRYSARPNELEDMCLAKFAVSYDYTRSPGKSNVAPVNGGVDDDNDDDGDAEHDVLDGEDADDGEGGNSCSVITLKNNLGFMRKRRKEAVLRVTSFKQVTEPEKYYHSRLLLYVPWRTEDELLGEFASYREKFVSVSDVAEHNAMGFNTHDGEMNDALNNIAEHGPPQLNWDFIAPMAEEESARAADDERIHIRVLDSDDDDDVNGAVHDLDVSPGTSARDENQTAPRNNLSTMYEREARKDIMSNSEYRSCMRSLNDGQRKIVMYNRRWCKERVVAMKKGLKHPGFKIALSGPGGTGKSHVIKMIRRDVIYLLERSMKVDPGQPLVLLTAPTGLAAFNIDGVTLHSAFMLSTTNSPVDTNYAKKSVMQTRLAHLALCVIDEISMVGRDNFESVARRIAQIKQTSDDWGDVSILAVGDFYQLTPVCQCAVYARYTEPKKPGQMVQNLWDHFSLHELKEIMRTNDDRFAKMLNSIRENEPTKGSPEDYMLRSRELKIGRHHAAYPMELMHVYARNDACYEWNAFRLNTLAGDLITCPSIDIAKDRRTNLTGVPYPEPSKIPGNLVRSLQLKVGSRVMLTMNVNVSDGLTNGAMGTVCAVLRNEQNRLKAVLVKFDCETAGRETLMGSKYKRLFPSAVPIYHSEVNIYVKQLSCRVSRSQFPLQLCWAVTIHKCQGMTLPGIVVDMSPAKGTFKGGQAYVAFSRVRSLNTLHIVNYDINQIRVAPHVMEAMRCMREKRLHIPDNPFPLTVDTTRHLLVMHLNVANVKAKLLDIQSEDIYRSAHVVCFTETHLREGDLLSEEMLGLGNEFTTFRLDREGSGGGILLAVRKDVAPMRVITMCSVEYVNVQIRFRDKVCYVMCVYRKPTMSPACWNTTMSWLLDGFKDVPMCVIGDVNDDVLSGCATPIVDMFVANGFTQHVSVPTRDSGTAIDHVYTHNISNTGVTCDVRDCYYSDHDIVCCSILFGEDD